MSFHCVGFPAFNARLGHFVQAVEFEALSPDMPTFIEGKPLRRHLHHLESEASAIAVRVQAPEVRGLVVKDDLVVDGVPALGRRNYYDEGAGVDFRCLSAIDVWMLGVACHELMIKDVTDAKEVMPSQTKVD